MRLFIKSGCWIGLLFATPLLGQLKVTSDFEGGSAKFLSIDSAGGRVVFSPGGDPKRGWPCWWYFRVDNIRPGQELTLELDGGSMRQAGGGRLAETWAMPTHASHSIDGGKTWRLTPAGRRQGKRMVWKQSIAGKTAWFAWGPPFVPSDATRMVRRLAARDPVASAFELCKSRAGRPVPALRIEASKDLPVVWIQARQHAWEAGSSWVCLGLAEWLLSDDAAAAALRKRSAWVIVPIMDVDSTFDGHGGKGQLPQDHNRDWSKAPHWPAVGAATRSLKQFDRQKRLRLFVDLHNPGPRDLKPFFYTVPKDDLSPEGRRLMKRFLDASRQQIVGPLELADRHRESGPGYDQNWRKISKNWVHRNTDERVVAVTLETSWNTPSSTSAGYRTVGRQLGRAVERFLLGP